MLSRLVKFFPRFKWYLAVVALTIPTFTSLLKEGYFPMHDDLQAMRVYQMELCFRDAQFPCRWVPDMGYQYGYPQFHYYGPMPYYVMTASRFLNLSLFDSVKLGFILPLVFGNLAMFLLASSIFGSFGGLISALAYGYSPYRASDLYSRGAMGETWAFVFFPLILYSIIKLYKKPNLKKSALLGISLALLFVTHNISTLIIVPMVGLIAIGLLVKSKEKTAFVKYGVIAVVWGILMAGTFILPVIFEKSFAHTESLIQGYFNYLAHFVTLKQLFVSTFWGYGSSEIGPTDDLSFFLGPVHLFLLVVSLSMIFINFMKRRLDLRAFIVIASTVLLFISLFMAHEKSTFIWKQIPLLTYLQFPWRFLVTANFFLCLATGYFLDYLNSKTIILLLLVFSFLIYFFNIAYFRPREWFNITSWEKFAGQSWDRQLTISIFDYLPIYAKFPPAKPAPIYPVPSGSPVSILDYRHLSSSIQFNSKSVSDSTITLPQFDFPGWTVYLDNRKIIHRHDNELGLITFDLPSGNHKIFARFQDTPVRLIGNLATLIFLPLSLATLLKKTPNND